MAALPRITTNLWFDTQAEEAANFYVSIFKRSRVGKIIRYGKAGYDVHHMPAGSVMLVSFELEGQTLTALNGGPLFKFSEAISLVVNCDTQEEIDYYWAKLTLGGDERAQQCGWLKDRYGLSWQVVPRVMEELVGDPDPERSQLAMEAMLKMKKLDIAELKRAHAGRAREVARAG